MSDLTPEEKNEALKATAAAYNAQNPTAETGDEAEAQKLAKEAELAAATGSVGHDGKPEVRADTAEELEAKAAKEAADKAAKEAAEAEKADTKQAADKDEDKANENASDDKSDVEWMSTDSKEFNAALGVMKASGMTPERASELFDEAANSGDLSKVDRAALVDEIGEDKAALVMAGFTHYIEVDGQAVLERINKVHGAVGGTENWSTMTKWARAKAANDETFKGVVTSLNTMINGDDAFQAEVAAEKFMALYNADSSNSTLSSTKSDVSVTAARQSPATPSATPITAREFAEQTDTAMRTLRGSEQAAKLKQLSTDRAAGRKQGI